MRSMLKRLAILLPVAAVHASLLFYMFSAGMEAVSAAGEQKTGAVLPGAQAVLTISGVTGGHAIKRTETPTGDLQKITWPAPDEKDPDEVMSQKAISSAPDAESGSAGRTAEISAHGIPQERHAAPERKSAGHAASGHKPGRSTERHRGDTAVMPAHRITKENPLKENQAESVRPLPHPDPHLTWRTPGALQEQGSGPESPTGCTVYQAAASS